MCPQPQKCSRGGGELDIIFVTEFALGYSVKILDAIDLGDSDVP